MSGLNEEEKTKVKQKLRHLGFGQVPKLSNLE